MIFKIIFLLIVTASLCLGISFVSAQEEKFEIKEILTGNLGKRAGEFGGLTEKELKRKEDPLAYTTASFPQDFTIDSVGNIIIADGSNHRLQIFSKDGKFLFLLSECGSVKLQYPYRVAVNRNDDIIVGEETNGRVYVFSREGKLLFKIEAKEIGIYNVHEIKVDNTNRIYIYQIPDKINIFSEKGVFIKSMVSSGFVMDSNNNIWSIGTLESNVNLYQIKPKGDWKYLELVGIDNHHNFYFRAEEATKPNEDFLLITDSQGSLKAKIKTFINGYYVYRWHISYSGEIYAMGINSSSKKSFLKIIKITKKISGQYKGAKP